jgi:hypothetical protein
MGRRVFGTGTGLDPLLDGGVRSGKSLLVYGSPGSGKTLLGLSYLREGMVSDERVVYVSFSRVPLSSILEPARAVPRLLPLLLSDEPMFYPSADLEVAGAVLDADRIVLDHPDILSRSPEWDLAFSAVMERCREQGSGVMLLSYRTEPLSYHSDGILSLSRSGGRMSGDLLKWPYSGGGEASEAEAGEWMA